MKVVFKGSAETVLQQMRAFLAAFNESKPAYPSKPVAEDLSSEQINRPAASEPDRQATVASEPTESTEVTAGNELPQKSDEHVCHFCGKYTGTEGWVRRHKKHCRSNPDRVPSPKEGKCNPGLQAFVNARKASPQTESESFEPNETESLCEESSSSAVEHLSAFEQDSTWEG